MRDLFVGKNHKSAVGILVEYSTQLTTFVRVKEKDTKKQKETFAEVFSEIDPEIKKTMTYDRGLEMTEHKILTEETVVKVYFADPRSCLKRGKIENKNRVLSQYFRKGTDFSKLTLDLIKFP